MGDIISYVSKMGGMSFEELGFNEVDSLIFSELCYLDFGDCLNGPTAFSRTIRDIRDAGFPGDNPTNDFSPDSCEALFRQLAESRRFGGVRMDFYVQETDVKKEMQFSAVTFRLSPRLHYLAFRGTDRSLAGWKEDLNMSFEADLPSQRAAAAYLERLAGRMRSEWILGGHSKGGNLAVYAAMAVPEKIRRNIARVYDHDGPGFLPGVLERPGYRAVQSRIRKTVPESAVVGLLLGAHERFTVVESSAKAIMQHNPFSWRVEGAAFVRADDTDLLSKTTDRTVNLWLSGLDAEHRRAFVDALYELLLSTGATTLTELTSDWGRHLPQLSAAVRKQDPQTRRMLLETVARLARASRESVQELLDERIRGWLNRREPE